MKFREAELFRVNYLQDSTIVADNIWLDLFKQAYYY